MARSLTSSASSRLQHSSVEEEKDDTAYLAALTAQRNANAFFEKYDKGEVQELLSLTSCNWFLGGDDFTQPVEMPPGIIKQMRNFTNSNCIILAPVDVRVPLDYKVVHQIVRELTVGIYCFNQVPCISLEPNFDQSTSCQLSPAYYDTRVGQILVNVDYTIKALWHGANIPRENRIRFSELWRSSMGVDSNGVPQTKKDVFAEFLTAGLQDISEEPCYQGIYNMEVNVDPTYDPNSAEEERLFSQHQESILLKLTSYLSSVQQHGNLFVFEGAHSLASVVRLTEERLELATYQRLQQRLGLQAGLVRGCLERKAEVCRDLAYLRLLTFLVPFLVGLKKRMKIPDLAQMLPAYSDDKLKTERELPPLLLGPAFACKHFPYKSDEYFHLHGGIEVDIGTPQLEEVSEETKVRVRFTYYQDTTYKEHFPVPVHKVNGNNYHVISIEVGSFYPQPNVVPWWEALNTAIKTLRGKRLPLSDVQLHEQFKKTFGYKKAINCKSVPFGLRAAAERGLSAVFYSLCRRNSPSHLGVLDEQGYSLLHHAAKHNHTHIICQLATTGVNLNQTSSGRFSHTAFHLFVPVPGSTPMHLAAQCGSLEAISCLLALQADHRLVDRRGWMAVHFAAYYGQVACIQALCRKDPELVEMQTTAEYRSCPLLLTATSGSVEALDYMLSAGANWRRRDSKGNDVVQLAALYFHPKVLRHLISLGLADLPVWKILVEMLHSEDHRRLEMAIRCLEALCVTAKSFWRDIMDAGGIPALLELMRSTRPALQRMAAAVVCHISERTPVCEALVRYGAVPVLVNLLGSQQAELHSRCALILADLAGHSDQYQSLIAQLLGSDLHDVLVNTVRCIKALCVRSPGNQTAVALAGGIPQLVELLTVRSEVLQEEVCAALAELAKGHRENQDTICGVGAVAPLVLILRGRKIAAQVTAARALEAIADHNPAIQARFLKKSAAKHLLRLLKVFQVEAREQGAVSLWALAGHTLKQQRLMAEHIGYHFILELILSSSDRMQYVGCQAVIALSRDSRSHQDGLCKENGVPPLVRLLRGSRTTERTLLSVIRSLGILCIGGAHTNNPNSQRVIAEEQAIPTLLELVKHQESLQVKVNTLEIDHTQKKCIPHGNLSCLPFSQQDICLEAGYALSLFAYNNTTQQAAILQNGGIPIAMYEPFLNSRNEMERAKAAFQIVVLAKVITDTDQVTLSARGVTVLVDLLQSTNPNTVVLTGNFTSLAHTRAGIPDAIVTMGAVGHLCAHLYSEEEEVRTASSSALGYLTFNRHAHRLLLVECRNTPSMYNLLTQHLIEDAKISHIFTAEFERQKIVGLPSLSLEINGGPPVPQRNKKGTFYKPHSWPVSVCRPLWEDQLGSSSPASTPEEQDSQPQG
uniref:Ankyrin and armadillo repeat containing n=1 Tax=Oncorhynchus kisutch TaxID=8019 RepID=A0A8C7MBK2_ONCKI